MVKPMRVLLVLAVTAPVLTVAVVTAPPAAEANRVICVQTHPPAAPPVPKVCLPSPLP